MKSVKSVPNLERIRICDIRTIRPNKEVRNFFCRIPNINITKDIIRNTNQLDVKKIEVYKKRRINLIFNDAIERIL
jgi:hypothetical protein